MQVFISDQLLLLGYNIAIFLIIIGGTAAFAWIFKRIFGRMLYASPHIAIRIKNYVFWLVWFVGIIFALSQLGLSVEILLLVITLIGVAIIVAGRDALKNLSARPFLDLYTQYKVGDSITIQGFSGKIVEINPINTILMNDKKELIIVPNALFLSEIMVNKTSRRGWEISIPILIDKKVDVIAYEDAVLKACNNMRRYFKKGIKPTCATTKIDDRNTEITMMVTLQNPKNKGVVVEEIKKKSREILDEMVEKNAAEK